MPKDEEYPVLTQFRGTLDYAKVAEIRDGKHGRVAVLAEPFESRMGVFGYDDLLKNGRAESAGFIVYTPDFWNANRSTEIERCMKQQFSKRDLFEAVKDTNEVEHRRMLGLPENGAVLKSEIEQAYKIVARRAHPDAGGSENAFKRLAAAKDALIERWQC